MNVQGYLPPPKGSGPAKITRTRHQGPVTRLRHMRLALEVALARAAGRLSRLAGRGGGTTIPGKVLATIDPGAVSTLAARLPLGSAIVSATNGKTTTAAFVAEILSPRMRLAHNSSGANLVSGVASTLLAARNAELGLFEVDEGAFPDVARRVRPRAVCLCEPLPRPARPLRRAREHRRALARGRSRAAGGLELVVNADDPQVGDLATERPGAVTFGLDDPAQARPSLQHAADSKYCLRCGTPYAYAAAYVGHLGDYRCPNCGHGRPALGVSARAVQLEGLEAASFDLATPEGTQARANRAPRALQRLQRAGRGCARARARSEPRRDRGRARRQHGLRSAGSSGSRSATGASCLLLIKNPAGANEVVRTLLAGGAPSARGDRPQRRDRRRARRLLDLGRRLRAAARTPRPPDRLRRARRGARFALQVRRHGRRRRSR